MKELLISNGNPHLSGVLACKRTIVNVRKTFKNVIFFEK